MAQEERYSEPTAYRPEWQGRYPQTGDPGT